MNKLLYLTLFGTFMISAASYYNDEDKTNRCQGEAWMCEELLQMKHVLSNQIKIIEEHQRRIDLQEKILKIKDEEIKHLKTTNSQQNEEIQLLRQLVANKIKQEEKTLKEIGM